MACGCRRTGARCSPPAPPTSWRWSTCPIPRCPCGACPSRAGCPGPRAASAAPTRVAVAPDGSAWVSSLGPNNGSVGRGSVDVFVPAARRRGASEPDRQLLLGGRPIFAAFAPLPDVPGGYLAYVPEQIGPGDRLHVLRVDGPGRAVGAPRAAVARAGAVPERPHAADRPGGRVGAADLRGRPHGVRAASSGWTCPGAGCWVWRPRGCFPTAWRWCQGLAPPCRDRGAAVLAGPGRRCAAGARRFARLRRPGGAGGRVRRAAVPAIPRSRPAG